MITKLRSSITSAHMIAVAALVLALGGGTFAVAKQGKAKGSIVVKKLQYVTASSPSNTSTEKTVTAFCPSGKHVVGGGYGLTGAVAEDVSVVINQGNASRTGWTVTAQAGTIQPTAWSVNAFAACASGRIS
jgi:hypothetical protein